MGNLGMRCRRPWLVLAVFLVWVASARVAVAQTRPWGLGHYQHTAWTVKDGAPSEISCLAQTADGYIWAGGDMGLYRFDGVRFKSFEPAAGERLLSTEVQSLLAVPSGGLWIGYEDKGISFLKDGHLVSYDAKSGFPGDSVYHIVRDRYGDIWADSNVGLMRFHAGRWTHMGAESGLPHGRTGALLMDHNGWLWLTIGNHIFSFDNNDAQFKDAGVSLTESYSFGMSQAPDGSFLLQQNGKSILHFKQIGRQLVQDPTSFPLSSAGLAFDRHGGLWVATLGDGIYRFADAARALQSNASVDLASAEHFRKVDGLSADYVWPALVDREGDIWFGTQHGLDSFHEASFSSVHLPDGIHDVAIARGSNGSMWVGSSNNPVLHVTDAGYVATVVPEYGFAMQQGSSDGSVLVGTRKGVWQIATNGIAKKLVLPPDKYAGKLLSTIVLDDKGRIWMSAHVSNAGLLRLGDQGWSLVPDVRQVSSLFADSTGTVWAGTKDSGLVAFRDDSRKTYGAIDGLDLGAIRLMSEHGHRLWVVGEEGVAYLKDGRFFDIHLDGNMTLRNVTGLLFPGDGSMWLQSIAGILRVSASELALAEQNPAHPMKYRLFDDADGIPGPAAQTIPMPSAAEGTDGRLWFTTQSGLITLDPHELVHNEVPPPVVIESVVVNGERINTAGDPTLPSTTKTIEISYTALSLAVPRKVEFRYRLDGIDRHWSNIKSARQVSYANLSPGTYTFRVIASNNDGVWNEQGAALTFTIKPGPLQTWWFRLLCAITFVLMLLLFVRWRIFAAGDKLRARLEVRDRERARIAHDIHDTLLQTVQALLIQVKQAADAIPASEPAQDLLNASADIAQLAVVEGRDRIVALQTFNERELDLSIALEMIGRHLEAIHPQKFTITTRGKCPKLPYSLGEEIIDIVREAILNAFMHSEGRNVAVAIAYNPHDVQITVCDDGKGVAPSVLRSGGVPGHWGLAAMRARAEKIGAAVLWSGEGVSGTRFKLRVPRRLTIGMILSKPIRAWRWLSRTKP